MEFRAADAPIRRVVQASVRKNISKKMSAGMKFQPDTDVEEAISEESERHLTILRDALFKTVEPYVFSLFRCSPTSDPRAFCHGGLLNWGMYGRNGGYAVRFRPSQLEAIVAEERLEYSDPIYFGPVHYADGDAIPESLASVFAIIDALGEEITDATLSDRLPSSAVIDSSAAPVAEAISSIKDDYFKDERESRVVILKMNNPPLGHTSHKLQVRQSAGNSVPFVEIFADRLLGANTPIDQIIVGPHPDRDRRTMTLEMFLKSKGLNNIEVVRSQVPYLNISTA